MIPFQDLFDMTAKPVRDLLFSKIRNRHQNLPIPIGSVRQIEIETTTLSPSSKPEHEPRSSTEMKEMMILNERGRSGPGHEFETKLDSTADQQNNLPKARTGKPTSFKSGSDAEERSDIFTLILSF